MSFSPLNKVNTSHVESLMRKPPGIKPRYFDELFVDIRVKSERTAVCLHLFYLYLVLTIVCQVCLSNDIAGGHVSHVPRKEGVPGGWTKENV